MAITPQNEYIAIAFWDKKNLTSSICFIRVSNPGFFNNRATPTRLMVEDVNTEPLLCLMEKFNFNQNYPRLKKNVNSFFLSLSFDTVVNQYPILTAIQLFNEKKVFGFVINGNDVIPIEPKDLGGDKAVVNCYYHSGEVYCVDNSLRLSKIKYFIH